VNPSPALDALMQVAWRRSLLTRDRVGPLRDLLIEAQNPNEIREDLECISEPEAVMLKELLPDDDHLLTAPYVRHACLGQGRLGTTWLGSDPDGRFVAIKIIHAHRLAPGADVELLIRDVAPLLNAKVSYLVPYRAAFAAADGRAVLVQDYIPGRDLGMRAQIKGPMSEPRALVCMRQIAKGLIELEKFGGMHGLIHPGNVLLDDDHRARLSDYGLVFGRTLQSLRKPFTPDHLQLLPWTAPELLTPQPLLLPASDLYQIGCLLYWLISGQTPFTGTNQQIMLQHANGARPDVRRIAVGTSEITAKTILKCLQVEPSRRYRSAADFGRSIQRNLHHILPDDEESGPHRVDAAGDSVELTLHLDEPAPTHECDPDAAALAPLRFDTPPERNALLDDTQATVIPPPPPVAKPLGPRPTLELDDD
jgi:eukaryotic-like serine/threonine-protein kinase